jgi:hypothetical protein
LNLVNRAQELHVTGHINVDAHPCRP